MSAQIEKKSDYSPINVALLDYGMCNLFSVFNACQYVGLNPFITSRQEELLQADVAILPGVGAFGEAIANLRKLDLINPIKDFVQSKRPFIGICLGMQLLMSESEEFGFNKGLNFINGSVKKFQFEKDEHGKHLAVPQIAWNRILSPTGDFFPPEICYFKEIKSGEYMYFVHSFYVIPDEKRTVSSTTKYGSLEYCSSISKDNIFGMQFHPEKSGNEGLKIYKNIEKACRRNKNGA